MRRERHGILPTSSYVLEHKLDEQDTVFASCFISPAPFAILRLLTVAIRWSNVSVSTMRVGIVRVLYCIRDAIPIYREGAGDNGHALLHARVEQWANAAYEFEGSQLAHEGSSARQRQIYHGVVPDLYRSQYSVSWWRFEASCLLSIGHYTFKLLKRVLPEFDKYPASTHMHLLFSLN